MSATAFLKGGKMNFYETVLPTAFSPTGLPSPPVPAEMLEVFMINCLAAGRLFFSSAVPPSLSSFSSSLNFWESSFMQALGEEEEGGGLKQKKGKRQKKWPKKEISFSGSSSGGGKGLTLKKLPPSLLFMKLESCLD